MDKIWYRNPSKLEVIGRCGGDEKTELPRRIDKSRTLKKHTKKQNKKILSISMIVVNQKHWPKKLDKYVKFR